MPQLAHDGARIHYEVFGPEDAPPVLMIQGVGVIGNGWRPQVDGLQERYRCAVFDNRGIGRSEYVGDDITVEAMARDARALLDALGWSRAHVIGHSMGGVIAQQLAVDNPARVRSLSLLCTFHRGRDGVRVTPRVIWQGVRTHVGTKRMRRNAFLTIVMPPDVLRARRHERDQLAAELAPLFGRDLAETPSIVLRQARALSAHDCSRRLVELGPIPTLVISGDKDRVASTRTGRRLARAIPSARYVEMEGAAHGLPINHAGLVNAMLAAHFEAADATA